MEAMEKSVGAWKLPWKLPRFHRRGNFHGIFRWKLPRKYEWNFFSVKTSMEATSMEASMEI